MPESPTPLERTLAEIALILDTFPKRRSRKLAAVRGDPDEAFHLLATYCFDIARKLELVCQVTLRYAAAAPVDPRLARRLLRESAALNRNGLTWRRRALLAERLLLKAYGEVGPKHDAALRRHAARGRARRARRAA